MNHPTRRQIIESLAALALLLAPAWPVMADDETDAPPKPVTTVAAPLVSNPVKTERVARKPVMPALPNTPNTPNPPMLKDAASRVPAVNLALIQSSDVSGVTDADSGVQELWSADAVGDEQPAVSMPPVAKANQVKRPAAQPARQGWPLPPPPPVSPAPALTLQAPTLSGVVTPQGETSENVTPQDPATQEATPRETQVASTDLNAMLQVIGQEAGAGQGEGMGETGATARPEQVLIDQLRQVMPGGGEGYIIERAMLPDLSNLPATGWKIQYDFKLPGRGIGATPYQAVVLGPTGQALRRFSGSVQIDREARGVQVTRLVRQGEALTAGDLKELDTRLSQLPRGAYDHIATLVGSTTRQELRPGQWLTEQAVAATEVIKRNTAVTIKLSRGAILITAPGVALQDGTMGEVIKVANAQSKREIYARVASKDEVQVIY